MTLREALEESEVLETTAFGGDGKQQEPLSILDQCTVLAGCINVENENPLHGLTHEETVHRYHILYAYGLTHEETLTLAIADKP